MSKISAYLLSTLKDIIKTRPKHVSLHRPVWHQNTMVGTQLFYHFTNHLRNWPVIGCIFHGWHQGIKLKAITLNLGSSPTHSLQNILQTFKKERVIFCKPFKMNDKKSNQSLIIFCAMLVAKYEQTYLQKSGRSINVGGIVSGSWQRLFSYISLLLLSCCPWDYHWYQYVEMSLPFQYTQTPMFH